jgi:RNA polymerase primary sigma factor
MASPCYSAGQGPVLKVHHYLGRLHPRHDYTAEMTGQDRLRGYLDAVARLPQLDEGEVRELATILDPTSGGDTRPSQDEREIRRIEARRNAARKRLIEGNLRLVVALAEEYRDQRRSQAELLEAGNMGLVRAVDTFDWQHGLEFPRYATQIIRTAIAAAIDDRY